MSFLKRLLNEGTQAGGKDNSVKNTRQDQINEVFVSGGECHAFIAKTEIKMGEAVEIVESDTVAACEDIERMYGVALFDVKPGEDVSVAERPVVLRLKLDDNVEAGDGVSLKTSTVWEKDDSQRERAIVMNTGDNGVGMVELRPVLS